MHVINSGCSSSQKIVGPLNDPINNSIIRGFNKTFSKSGKIVSSLGIKSSSNRDLQFALQQFNQNKYEVAEFYLKKTLVKFPDNLVAMELLPWTYFYRNQYDKALATFRRTKALHKKNPNPSVGIGWCYLALGHYEESIEQFEHAKILGGDSYQINKGIGFTYLKMNKKVKADESFAKIYNPHQIKIVFDLWETWQEQNTSPQINILPTPNKPLSIFTLPIESPRYSSLLLGLPKNINPWTDKAWNAFGEGKYKKSLDIFENLSTNTGSPDIKNGLAWSYLKNKEINTASILFEELKETWPNFIGSIQGINEIDRIKRRQTVHADHYLDINKLGIAEQKYKEILNKYPNWEYPLIQLGKLKLERKDYFFARKYFLDALDISPNNQEAKAGINQVRKVIDSNLFQADFALESGNYKKSALLYAKYIREYKPNVNSFLNLRKTFHKLGLMDDPWIEYNSKQQPSTPSTSFFSKLFDKIGLTNSKLNNIKHKVPSSNSSLAHAYNGLGWSQYHKKKYIQAAEKFRFAFTDREYFLEASKGLGLALYNVGQYKEAANTLKPVVQLNPEELDIAYKLDMSILMSWDVTSAKKYFLKNLVYYPLRSSLYMGLGWLNYRDKKHDLAIEYFLKAISLDPSFALTDEFKTLLSRARFGWQIYNKIGWAYYEKRDYKNAITMFQISLKKQPNKSESRKGLGYALNKFGNITEAARYLNQALELNNDPNPVSEMVYDDSLNTPYSTTSTARTILGKILLKQGKPYEAIAIFQEELKIRPKLAAAHDGLGWSYLELNKLTQSRTAFKSAIKHQPVNFLSHEGMEKVKQKIATIKLSKK